MLEAGVHAIYYMDDFNITDADERAAYEAFQAGFPGGVHQLAVANSTKAA
jgi:hypothetical protein